MISVLILTKNEEKDLPGCLASISWCDDIHVFDSFSNDGTVELALELGAKVVQRKFDGYACQRNAALHTVIYKYPWVLILDADERVPGKMYEIMMSALQSVSASTCAFRMRRKDFLFGKWLKHSQISPLYIRLVKPHKVRYHREINEVLEVDGEIEELNGFFNHYPFSKGITRWLDKHNVYSTMEASRWMQEQNGIIRFSLAKALMHKDFHTRRFHQKGLFYKMPGRPVIRWLYMVFCRRAFMDGYAGVVYATLQSIYEYFIVLKSKELLFERQAMRANSTNKPPVLPKLTQLP